MPNIQLQLHQSQWRRGIPNLLFFDLTYNFVYFYCSDLEWNGIIVLIFEYIEIILKKLIIFLNLKIARFKNRSFVHTAQKVRQ